MLGERLDLTSDIPTPVPPATTAAGNQRRFVGIHFTCCDVYTRVYVNRDETAYSGNCPRCTRKIILKIGPGGTSSRFFTAN